MSYAIPSHKSGELKSSTTAGIQYYKATYFNVSSKSS